MKMDSVVCTDYKFKSASVIQKQKLTMKDKNNERSIILLLPVQMKHCFFGLLHSYQLP